MGGFWRDAWGAFRGAVGPLATAAALVLALLGSFWDPGIRVSIGLLWLAALGIAVVAILVTSIKMAVTARRDAQAGPPRATHVHVPEPVDDGSPRPVTLVLQRSTLFAVNILVTIYYVEAVGPGQDDIFERAIGIGRVANIQGNGLLQGQVLKEDAVTPDCGSVSGIGRWRSWCRSLSSRQSTSPRLGQKVWCNE